MVNYKKTQGMNYDSTKKEEKFRGRSCQVNSGAYTE
jgi:hypothetical protein